MDIFISLGIGLGEWFWGMVQGLVWVILWE